MKTLQTLESNIRIKFTNKKLLKNAFVHRSYLNEHPDFALPSNEKLEFLGDSVLSLCTSVYLYSKYPKLQEGDYTAIKAAIVRTESLAESAKALDLGAYLLLSKGENESGGRNKITLLADCLEALIASIFLDQGYEVAKHFIHTYLFQSVQHIVENKLYLSPKSYLQEIVQSRYKILPEYSLISDDGPDHNKVFTVRVTVKGVLKTTGKGDSKKRAEEVAAQKAVEKLTK